MLLSNRAVNGEMTTSVANIETLNLDSTLGAMYYIKQFHSRRHIDVSELETVEVGDLIHAIDDEECEEPPEDVVLPELTKAEDVTGKPCCIVYEDCLLKLVSLKVFTATLKIHISIQM